eukprot:COSAG04_NODE_317_length_16987_cov_33.718025_6_plen_45_part_00
MLTRNGKAALCSLNRKGPGQVTYLSAGAHVTCLEKTDHTISTFK